MIFLKVGYEPVGKQRKSFPIASWLGAASCNDSIMAANIVLKQIIKLKE